MSPPHRVLYNDKRRFCYAFLSTRLHTRYPVAISFYTHFYGIWGVLSQLTPILIGESHALEVTAFVVGRRA